MPIPYHTLKARLDSLTCVLDRRDTTLDLGDPELGKLTHELLAATMAAHS